MHGGDVLDISELIPRPKIFSRFLGFLTPFSQYRVLRDILPLRWAPSVFKVNNGKISLNPDNKEVLIRFLQKYGELEIEQMDADDG